MASTIQPGTDASLGLGRARLQEDRERAPRLLCIGGEDHGLRLPFLLKLKAAGFDVHAAASCEPRLFDQAGIAFHGYRLDRSFRPAADWNSLRQLRTIIAGVKPDVVQSFDTKPNLLTAMLAAEQRDTRFVRTINGTGRIYSSPSLSARVLRPVYDFAQRRASRAGAVTVFQNEADNALFTRKNMVRQTLARMIRGSGIDVEAFDRAANDEPRTAQLREHLKLTASNIVITVTRIEPLKGIGTLLAAAELVQDVNPDTQFLLVGPWEEADARHARLRDLCERSRSLRWIGPRSDVHALLKLARVFVLPTEFREGLPRVLLEAALAELPIVTTDMPGCISVVEHGRNGFIVPPRAPGALAAAVLELLASPELRREFGRNGSDHVRRSFSLSRVVEEYSALYRTPAQAGPSVS